MIAAPPRTQAGTRAFAAPSRFGFSFAADGTTAACLTVAGASPPALERWSFSGSTAERRLLPARDGEPVWTQVCCLRDGRVLASRPGHGVHRLSLVETSGSGLAERFLTTVESPWLRLMDTPEGGALGIGTIGGGRSALWRLLPGEPWWERVAELPGLLTRGCWLDTGGRLLGINQWTDGTARPTMVDLAGGTAEPLPASSPGQHLMLSAPRSGLLLLAGPAGPAGDRLRLGHVRVGGGAPPRFPDFLDAIEGTAAPLAVDPSGDHVALRVDRGVRSHLLVYTPRRERVREIDIPAGVIIHGDGRWSDQGLRFAFTTPTLPAGIATVALGGTPDDTPPRWDFAAAGGEGEPRWADARVCEFDGPAGRIETVVYGHDDWRDARHLLVALHGGPEAATQVVFDPLWQTLAGAGVAIVAPNHRGSTGYGLAHRQALYGAWGGPDLADIRHLVRELIRRRRSPERPMLFGASYGAFLALLAAGADPELWSHCVAVSPFVSGPLLYDEGSPGVRALVDRLGGRTAIDDELGPRDLTRLCGRITARLMVVHSADDEVIPVGQSHRLRECLLRSGRREGDDFVYREPRTGGHDPIGGTDGAGLARELLRFIFREPFAPDVADHLPGHR